MCQAAARNFSFLALIFILSEYKACVSMTYETGLPPRLAELEGHANCYVEKITRL